MISCRNKKVNISAAAENRDWSSDSAPKGLGAGREACYSNSECGFQCPFSANCTLTELQYIAEGGIF